MFYEEGLALMTHAKEITNFANTPHFNQLTSLNRASLLTSNVANPFGSSRWK